LKEKVALEEKIGEEDASEEDTQRFLECIGMITRHTREIKKFKDWLSEKTDPGPSLACQYPQEPVAGATASIVKELDLSKSNVYLNSIQISAQFVQSINSLSPLQRTTSVPYLFGLNKNVEESDLWNAIFSSEGHDVLKALHSCKDSLVAVRELLPPLLEFTYMLFERCRGTLTQNEAAQQSISEFLSIRVTEADRPFWRGKFRLYADAFNQICSKITRHECKDIVIQQVDENTKLAVIDFVCIADLVSFIVMKYPFSC
jgi:hypothetical protein